MVITTCLSFGWLAQWIKAGLPIRGQATINIGIVTGGLNMALGVVGVIAMIFLLLLGKVFKFEPKHYITGALFLFFIIVLLG